ncbi:N-acetylmuramidase family protein, partial [Azospirillum argentinense]|uniref:N-acetylmuramidase family protein n=1 Tax=Azospirillum argentinense TaxID=2970906 RepID=UPI0032DEA9A0
MLGQLTNAIRNAFGTRAAPPQTGLVTMCEAPEELPAPISLPGTGPSPTTAAHPAKAAEAPKPSAPVATAVGLAAGAAVAAALSFLAPTDDLTDDEVEEVARGIRCDPAMLLAIAEVESAGKARIADGRITILYEAHIFDRETGGRFRGAKDRHGVALSVKSWDRSLYGKAGAHQYERLEDAMKLDRAAALRSCSWGPHQIMGFHAESVGCRDVEAFVTRMGRSTEDQLDTLADLLTANKIDRHLRAKDFVAIARAYNGPR